jgi:arsenate reductase
MITIYTYAKCSTCRKAVAHLTQRKAAFTEIPIRERPPSLAELKRMLAAHDGEVKRLFNRSGQDYRALGLAEKLPGMSDAEALKLLATNGNLVKRPFAFIGRHGVVGYDRERWDEVLST